MGLLNQVRRLGQSAIGGTVLNAGGMAGNVLRGMGTFYKPKSYVRQMSLFAQGGKAMLGGDFNGRTLLQMGKASANLLGKGSGLVMGARLLSGRNPVRDERTGRRNVPFIPFI